MSKIKRLSPHEAQKIAAGEVVERPANIVKELLENAVDAQATRISIAIEDGGKKRIEIIDDGFGMDKDDAQLCFERHATSKIVSIDQLTTIQTFGFRGEALASIASVSNVTLITAEETALTATKLNLRAGKIETIETTARSRGTTIIIEDLFCTVPARKKFLKTRETEARLVSQLIDAFALINPGIHFTLISDGKTVANYLPTSTISERAHQIWPQEISNHLFTLNFHDQITIAGLISDHQIHRYDRSSILFFVNNRWIKNSKLATALIRGYNHVLPPMKFPLAAITISIDPELVDINTHPRKEEVQFAEPRRIEQAIEMAVKKQLAQQLSISVAPAIARTPVSSMSIAKQEPVDDLIAPHSQFSPKNSFHSSFSGASSPSKTSFGATSASTRPFPMHESQQEFALHNNPAAPETLQQQLPLQSNEAPSAQENERYHYLGQLDTTYLLLDHENGLMLIDQHAAHERILYEQYAHKLEQAESITLIFPQLIKLSSADMALLLPHLDFFHKKQMIIDQINEKELMVRSLPVYLKEISMQEVINQFIGWIIEYQTISRQEFAKLVEQKLYAQLACKSAVKAGDILTPQAAQKLIKDLYATENKTTCPHGRPTNWLLTRYEIEKKFKRVG